MTKSKYYIVTFPASSVKNPLATLAGNVIGSIDHVFEIFGLYTEETYGKSPLQIMHMTLKNESLFGPEILGLVPYSSDEKNQLQSIKASKIENRRRESAETEDVKMDISSDKDTKIEVSTTNGSETEVDTNKDVEMEISTAKAGKMEAVTAKSDDKKINVEEGKVLEPEERIKDLIRRNIVKIRSMSVIRESKIIGIELNMDLSFGLYGSSPTKSEQWHGSSPTKSEHYFGLSEKTNSPIKGETKSKSTESSPLKDITSKITIYFPNESIPSIDYTDSKLLEFLAKRLSSLLSSRKTYMEQICNCFQSFLKHVRDLNNTIDNIRFVVENLPMAKEAYLTDELLKMRADLLNKAHEMSGKMEPLVKNSESNVDVSERTLKEIDAFEKEQGPTLSTKAESVLTIEDLKRIEATLREMCKEADAKVVQEDRMWSTLFPFYSDFEWLIKHFIKFLIITGILEPRK